MADTRLVLDVRKAHEIAQSLCREIRAIGEGDDAHAHADSIGGGVLFDKLWQLAGQLGVLRRSVGNIEDGQQRTNWTQRWRWMHEEFIALAGEHLQDPSAPPPDPNDAFWSRTAELLYAGSLRTVGAAESVSRAKHELASVQAELRAMHAQVADRDERLRIANERIVVLERERAESAAAAAASEHGNSKEVLEMRTRLIVLQQEMSRKAGEAAKLAEQHTALVAERDALRAKAEMGQATDQAVSEQAKAESIELRQRVARLEEHNVALSESVLKQSGVVERLIELNEELAAAHNAKVPRDVSVAIGAEDGLDANDELDEDVPTTTAHLPPPPSLLSSFEAFMKKDALSSEM